jgi:hypothetical protein
MSYRINTPHVAHETIDGETIIIDFESGAYYSLQNVAHFIWQKIDAGDGVESIVAQVGACYRGERSQMAAAVRAFIEELAQNALIVADARAADPQAVHAREGDAQRAPAMDASTVDASITEGTITEGTITEASGHLAAEPFEPPVLEQYTDMQDLLLLDPIHEVDEQGWPMTQEQQEAKS